MVSENESLPEFQRIGRLEFELDIDEQSVILEKTKEEVNQVSRKSMHEIVLIYTHINLSYILVYS